jgi:hypothetical protein
MRSSATLQLISFQSALGIEPAKLLAELPRDLAAAGVALGDQAADALLFDGAEVPSAEAHRSTGLGRAHGARARELTTDASGGGPATATRSWPVKFHGSQRSR